MQSKDLASTVFMFHLTLEGCRSLVVPVRENIISFFKTFVLEKCILRKMTAKDQESLCLRTNHLNVPAAKQRSISWSRNRFGLPEPAS